MGGVQRRIHRPPVRACLPQDFPGRIVRLQQSTGLSWRALARLLSVRPLRLRQWRSGRAVPNAAHLFRLLTIAEGMGLREGILMRPEDMPEGVVVAAMPQSSAEEVSCPPPGLMGSGRLGKLSGVRCLRGANLGSDQARKPPAC